MISLVILEGPNAGDSIRLHARRFGFSSRNNVTSHPIEQGVAVSDHIQRQLDDVQIEVVVSDTSLPRGEPSDVMGTSTPVEAVLAFMERASRDLVAILGIPGKPTLLDYALTEWPSQRDHIARATFTLGFREIRRALAQTVKIPPAAAPDTPAAPSEQELGPQAVVEQPASILSRFTGLGG